MPRCLVWWGGGVVVVLMMMLNEKVASKVIDFSPKAQRQRRVWSINTKLCIRFSFIRLFCFSFSITGFFPSCYISFTVSYCRLPFVHSSLFIAFDTGKNRENCHHISIYICVLCVYISYVSFTCLPSNLLTYIRTCSLACIQVIMHNKRLRPRMKLTMPTSSLLYGARHTYTRFHTYLCNYILHCEPLFHITCLAFCSSVLCERSACVYMCCSIVIWMHTFIHTIREAWEKHHYSILHGFLRAHS